MLSLFADLVLFSLNLYYFSKLMVQFFLFQIPSVVIICEHLIFLTWDCNGLNYTSVSQIGVHVGGRDDTLNISILISKIFF